MTRLELVGLAAGFAGACATGWGWLAGVSFRALTGEVLRGPMAAFGLALILGVCGALNALGALTLASFCFLSAIGLLGFLAGLFPGSPWGPLRSERRLEKALTVLAAACLVLPLVVRGIGSFEFSNDDGWGYLVAVRRILDLGTVGTDPFNYRLFFASAGGMASLQAPAVALAGWSSVRVVDQALGLLILFTSFAWLADRLRSTWAHRIAAMAGFSILATHEIINTTSYYLTFALLVALAGFLVETGNSPVPSGICAGTLTAGLAALKVTALPSALLLVAFASWHRYRSAPRSAARFASGFVVAAASSALFWYVPKMGADVVPVELRHGSGQDQVDAAYILWWMLTRPGIMGYGWLLSLLLLAAVSVVALRGTSRLAPAGGLLGAVLVGCVATTWITGGVGTTRFSRPVAIFACLVVALFLGAREPHQHPSRGLTVLAVVVSFALCNDATTWTDWLRGYREAMAGLRLPLPTERETERGSLLGAAQAGIEPGTGVLVRTDLPYLMDFSRNRLHVVDIAYGVSPWPGMHTCADAGALAAYLRSLSIRYVLYSYGNEANLTRQTVAQRLATPSFTPWQRAFNRRVPRFHALLDSLITGGGVVYDDGKTAVVDLARTSLASR